MAKYQGRYSTCLYEESNSNLGDGMWVPYLLRCHRRPRADANLDLMCPGTSILGSYTRVTMMQHTIITDISEPS